MEQLRPNRLEPKVLRTGSRLLGPGVPEKRAEGAKIHSSILTDLGLVSHHRIAERLTAGKSGETAGTAARNRGFRRRQGASKGISGNADYAHCVRVP